MITNWDWDKVELFFNYEKKEKQFEGRCGKCENHHIVYASGGWSFYGCYCSPYHGKWVAQIKQCPKGGS